MPATVDIVAPASVVGGTPFIVTVEVRRVGPGQSITIMLEQKRGVHPFWPAQSAVSVADDASVASASFKIVLAGPGNAVMLATAYDRSGTYFAPDGGTVEVL